MKKLLETIGTVAASFVEQNPNLLEYIRTHHFKGKVIVVSKLQEIFLPEDEFVADVKGIKYQLNIKDWIQKNIYFTRSSDGRLERCFGLSSAGEFILIFGQMSGFTHLTSQNKPAEMERCLPLSPNRKPTRNL